MNRGKHKTLEPKLKMSCRWIESLIGVTAVIVTRSENCRHKFAPGTIRIKADVPAGFKCNGYGGFGVTDIYVYVRSSEREAVRKDIEKRYPISL